MDKDDLNFLRENKLDIRDKKNQKRKILNSSSDGMSEYFEYFDFNYTSEKGIKQMDLKSYQKKASYTAVYPYVSLDINGKKVNLKWVYPILGLQSEVGEVAGKLKKILRDKNGLISSDDKKELSKELGDCLWYIAALASELDLGLDSIAEENIKKLSDRKKNGTIQGSGDNR